MTVDTAPQDQGSERSLLFDSSAELLDGWLVHASAIRHGLHTWLLPGQALMTGSDAEKMGELSFAHGVPLEGQLSMATLVQDKRIRRAMLEEQNIPIPKGATFSIGRGFRDARRYASRIGYPVVVKPMVGDNTIETLANIASFEDLREAIRFLKIAPPFRPHHIASSYAFTAIQAPREDGSKATRDSYRYLIEKELSGRYIRTLSVHGELVSAVHSPHGAWSQVADGKDLLGSLDHSFEALIRRVCETFSGLSVVAVDFVVSQDPTLPLNQQDVAVVEVSERPWLQLQRTQTPNRVYELADAILAGSAEHHGIKLKSISAGPVARSVRWEGVPHETEFLNAIKAAADRLGVTGWAAMEDRIGGVACGHLEGSPEAIALMGELAVAGELDPAEAAMSMESSDAQKEPYRQFTINSVE